MILWLITNWPLILIGLCIGSIVAVLTISPAILAAWISERERKGPPKRAEG